MKFACVDTSTFTESVALVEGELICGERSVRRPYGHASGLHADLRELLEEIAWSVEDIDAFIIGTGPGSFTGLRVGMAAVKGLAYALNKPLYGISTAKALLAALGDQTQALALIDARRGEVYAEGDLLVEPRCFTPQSLIEQMSQEGISPRILVGEGAVKHKLVFQEAWPKVLIPQSMSCHLPRASLLATGLEEAISKQGRAVDSLVSLEPIYVRKSDAEINYPDGFPSEARLFS